MMQGPIEMTVTESMIRNWRAGEQGSFEDNGGDPRHIFNILGRSDTRVILLTPLEVRSAIVSAMYHGDAGEWEDRIEWRESMHRFSIRLMGVAREEGIS